MLLVSLKDFKKEPMERKMMALSVNEAHTDAFDMLVEIVGIDSEDRLMLALVDTMMNGWTPPDLGFETEGEAYPDDFLLTVGKGLKDLRRWNVQDGTSFYVEHFSKSSGELDSEPGAD